MRENSLKNGYLVTLLLYQCLRTFFDGYLVTTK